MKMHSFHLHLFLTVATTLVSAAAINRENGEAKQDTTPLEARQVVTAGYTMPQDIPHWAKPALPAAGFIGLSHETFNLPGWAGKLPHVTFCFVLTDPG